MTTEGFAIECILRAKYELTHLKYLDGIKMYTVLVTILKDFYAWLIWSAVIFGWNLGAKTITDRISDVA